jgi:hypothetical protein
MLLPTQGLNCYVDESILVSENLKKLVLTKAVLRFFLVLFTLVKVMEQKKLIGCTHEGGTKRCRLSWLTTSAMSPNAGGEGELRGLSQ